MCSSIISTFINAYPNKKKLDYSYIQQIKDILPSIIMSLIMGAIVYPIKFLSINSVIIVILQVIAGIIVYIFEAKIIKSNTYDFVVGIIKEKKAQMRKNG